MTKDNLVDLPFISVVIPTLNVAKYLDQTLSALRKNDYPLAQYEIIIVDNGSSDKTLEIANNYNVQILQSLNVTISALRNIGAKVAKGPIIAFLDADCVPSPTWLRAGVIALEKENQLVGFVYDVPDNANWIENDWFCQRDSGRTNASSLAAGNMFLRKDFFWSVNGFDEALITGEDTELCLRLKLKGDVISDDRIRVVHLGNPKTLMNFYRREVWYGIGALGTFKVEKFDKPLIGTMAFISSVVFFALGLVQIVIYDKVYLLVISIGMMLSLIAATLFYRRKYVLNVAHAVRLALLYFVYYLGRASSIWLIITKKRYHHQISSRQK